MVAAIFESLGALSAGGGVTSTIRGHIFDASSLLHNPHYFILGMLAAMLAAATWLLVASFRGWPVSTTHTIVGALVGYGLLMVGAQHIYWGEIVDIVLSWIVTPLISGGIAFVLIKSVQFLVFDTDDPLGRARRYVPVYIFITVAMIVVVTVTKGLKMIDIHLSGSTMWMLTIGLALVFALLGAAALHLIHHKNITKDQAGVEKTFGVLMVVTACAMAFAHGSNDVANAIGPLAAIIGVIERKGVITSNSMVPMWCLLLGAVGIVVGLLTFGQRVIATVGRKITELTPSRGFAAELATATTVMVASGLSLPVSTTQTLIGGVLGVGLAHGRHYLNTRVITNIFISWAITVPIGAALTLFYFWLMSLVA